METNIRKLTTVYTPPSHPGFLGRGHTARPVIQVAFTDSDPFIMLMDDIIHKDDYEPSGGPHPHGGFETVSLVIEGELGDEDHGLNAGDFEIMTAGSGIVHTETIEKPTTLRLLQLWLNLPRKDRNALPRIQKLKAHKAPATSGNGISIKVYSGTFAGAVSPVKNYTPIIVSVIDMQANASLSEVIPSDFSTFLYGIEGRVQVGDERKELSADQVGWLDRSDTPGSSLLNLTAGPGGARLVLYAAQPQRHEIVSHGPFISDSMEDIKQRYAEYRAGRLMHISEVPAEQQFVY